jgi:glycosyltransferase involved in cell wall biosynthesis
LIPYRATAWARACNPVKTLEYLAAGRPVVSTNVPAVRAYAPLVRIATDVPEFITAVESALDEDSQALQPARRAVVEGASWQARADALCCLVAAARGRGDAALVSHRS